MCYQSSRYLLRCLEFRYSSPWIWNRVSNSGRSGSSRLTTLRVPIASARPRFHHQTPTSHASLPPCASYRMFSLGHGMKL